MDTSVEGVAEFKAINLKEVLKGLKDKFYTLEEFPLVDRKILPEGVLAEAMKVKDEEIRSFAFRLTGKELEALLMDLKDTKDSEEIHRAVHILKTRSTERINKLAAILFQYNFDSKSLSLLLNQLALNNPSCEEAFIKRLGLVEDKFPAICEIVDENNKKIFKTFENLNISDKSPFAEEAAFRYLSDTCKDGYMANLKWIVNIIEARPADVLEKLIKNYLGTFTVFEYHDGINLAILAKLGQPNVSIMWDSYQTELRDKFKQWHFLNRLKIHTIKTPKKYNILSKYYKEVHSSIEIPDENIMAIDFGDIVVADIADRQYSFFYEKNVFDEEMKAWENSKKEQQEEFFGKDEKVTLYQPTFLRMDKKNHTARDFIIEEIEAPCVRLSYEGIEALYINEMMDIKIGLAPDLRRKQLAKLKKRSRRS